MLRDRFGRHGLHNDLICTHRMITIDTLSLTHIGGSGMPAAGMLAGGAA